MPRPRKELDLRTIERDYRTGAASMREIARRSGVSERSIRRRIHERGWVPDLAARTNAMVAAGLANHTAPSDYAAVSPVMPHSAYARTREDEFVAEAAAQKLAVIEQQKLDIARHLSLHRKLVETFEDEMERAFASRGNEACELKKLRKFVNLLDMMSRTLSRLIPMEARVHKLDYGADAKRLEPRSARVVILDRNPSK